MQRKMKALTVKQPWANLLAWGTKTVEVRSWATEYRGDLLITASTTPKIVPHGCAIAVVELVDVRPLELDDMVAACLDPTAFRDDLWAWVIRAPRRLVDPLPIKGGLGLWDVSLATRVIRDAPRR